MNLVKEFLLLKAKVDKLYCQLIAKSPDEQDPTVPNHVKNIKQEDIDNWNNVEDVEVQITEDTDFAQVGQNQKDFNRNVSDYKTNSDLKNQEQDDRLTAIEGDNTAQYDLINDLNSELDSERTRNDAQDSRLVNLEGINYIWSPTNRTLTLFDREGNQLSQVSLVSLDNEGTDIRYNASTLSLELYNADNELLDSIPVSSFIGSVGTQLQLNSNQLQLKDSQGNILSTVGFEVSNIQGLQTALDSKLNKGNYPGNAFDLKTEIDGKLTKPTTTSNTTSYPFVVGEDGNGNSARLPAGDLGKNFFNSDLNNTTARNHTMNAGVTVNTLGNPHTLSGLPNKNADITNFRKVRVQNTSGLDAVVDSKNLLTDGVTSMTDAEKDAWRLAQRKSNENYSTGQPRIDFINPVIIDKTLNFVQYVSIIGLNLYLGVNSVIKVYRKSDDTLYKEITTFERNQNMPTILLFGENFQNWEVGKYYFKIYNGISGVESIINKNLIIDVRDTIEELSIPALSFTSNNSNVVFTGNSNNLITNQIYYAKSNEPLVTSSDLIDGVGLCFSFSYRGWMWSRYASRITLGLVDSSGNISDSSLDFGIITKDNGVMQSIPNPASSGSSIVTGNTLKNFTLYILIKNGVVTIYSPEVSFSQSFIYNQVKDLFLKYGMVDGGNSSDGGEFRLNNILKKFKI